MSHKHLSIRDREILERLLRQGYSQRKISAILGITQSAVSQEISRNKDCCNRYRAKASHSRALRRRKKTKGGFRKDKGFLLNYVREKLEQHWSPEQISGRLKRDYPCESDKHISFKSIYLWVRKGIDHEYRDVPLRGYHKYFRTHRGRKRTIGIKAGSRSAKTDLPRIEDRPEEGFGVWESDLISGYNKSGYIATFVERSTGFIWAEKLENKSIKEYNRSAIECIRRFGSSKFKSITVDRGKEFYGYKSVGVQFYFCNPMSPNERALNENMNGLLRQYFPKRTSFKDVKSEDVYRAVEEINNRPKKRFGYMTTMEVLDSMGIEM
ncbi:IS30 family transposase [Limisalsivibrio acetivorans]|uniref:IS30 family transposase n=1 Tax=Limisalsivibrio acetivorans TaxID=1304888 RepID=UPI0003B787C6|nr:IS30 family transposase [Limisalsivibrio acetivorans]